MKKFAVILLCTLAVRAGLASWSDGTISGGDTFTFRPISTVGGTSSPFATAIDGYARTQLSNVNDVVNGLSNDWETLSADFQTLESNALTSVQFVGGWYNPDWFTLTLTPYPYSVISVGETQAVNSVMVSEITVDSAAGYLLNADVVRMSTFTGGVVYVALSNATIETVVVTNCSLFGDNATSEYEAVLFDSGLSSGDVATITATLNGFERMTNVVYVSTNVQKYWEYISDGTRTLRAYVNTSLAARAAVSNRTMELYEDGWPSYGTGGTWVRNTNCWASGIDLTCASPYNTQGNQAEKGGTAITRQHVVYAAHYSFTNNARLLFVDATNGLHWRAIVNQKTVPGTDARVGLLDEELPETITPAKLMQPSDNGRFLGAYLMRGGIGVRTIHLKAVESNDPKTFAKWACYSCTAGPDYANYGMVGSSVALIGRVPDSDYASPIIVGDSGQPTFVIIGTNTVLYSTFSSSVGGPNYGYLCDSIEQVIVELDGGTVHTNLTYIDLSEWRDYNVPPTP